MANAYQVEIGKRYQPGTSGGFSSGSSHPAPLRQAGSLQHDRYLHIVTDTMQNAMSIARGRLGPNEEIMSVYISGEDIIVDVQACSGQS